jgi:CBS domain-containing protein
MQARVRESIDEQLGEVGDIMQRNVVSLSPDQPMGDAVRALERAGVSGGPVIEDGRLVGVVGLGDLFRAAGIDPGHVATSGPWHRYERFVDRSGRSVRYAMSRRVVSLPATAPISQAASLMRMEGVNRIPVLDDAGSVVGIVARDDVIEAVARTAATVHARERVRVSPSGSPLVPD